jgi:hypothetical protein
MRLKSNALKAIVGVTAITAAISAIAEPAHALSVSLGSGTTSSVSGVTNITFDDGYPDSNPLNPYTSGIATYSGKGAIVQGSQTNRYLAPGSNTGPAADQTPYLTFGSTQEPGDVTIKFTQALDYFGLYWGSVDSYNSIQFFKGATQIGSDITGSAIATLLGKTGTGNFNVDTYVNFFAGANESFDKIVMKSGNAAFESDNHAYRAVPTPALLPGLIGLGVAAIRKRKQEDGGEATAPAEANV